MAPATSGKVEISLARCLSVFDESGGFNPLLDDTCSLHQLQADLVVMAVGHKMQSGILPEGMLDPVSGWIKVDPVTLKTGSNEKVFACGDSVSGPSSVVHAMASGKQAAISADRFLQGRSLSYGRDHYQVSGFEPDYEAPLGRKIGGPRGRLGRLPVEQRTLDKETDLTLNPEQARGEAERCLSCGRAYEANQTCWYCLPCEIECPAKALTVNMPYLVR